MAKTKQRQNTIDDIYAKYAPKNITLRQFKKEVEAKPELLESIGGNFSTRSSELFTALKKYENKKIKKNKFRCILKDHMSYEILEHRAREYAKIYEEIICSNDAILKPALIFDMLTEEQKQELATNIVKGLNKHFDIKDKLVIKYTEKYKGEEAYEENKSENRIFGKLINRFKRGYIQFEVKGELYSDSNIIALYRRERFADFIETLSHEYGHFIDYKYPNFGMLGSQLADYSKRVYVDVSHGYDKYRKNPTEISSYKIGDVVEKHVVKALSNKTLERPGLVLNCLKNQLDYLKATSAALKFKCDKVFKKAYNMKYKMLKEKGIDIFDFSEKKRIRIYKKLEQENPKIKKEIKIWSKLLDKYVDVKINIDKCEQLIKKIEHYNNLSVNNNNNDLSR